MSECANASVSAPHARESRMQHFRGLFRKIRREREDHYNDKKKDSYRDTEAPGGDGGPIACNVEDTVAL